MNEDDLNEESTKHVHAFIRQTYSEYPAMLVSHRPYMLKSLL
jgi:hypothetical protein